MASSDFSDKPEMERQLLQAAISGDLRLLKEVAESLDKGKGMAETIMEIRCSKGLCALHHAAAAGRTEICKCLIEELGIPVDFRSSSPPPYTYGDLIDGTPLLYAVKEGRSVTVNYLIERGADPNATDKDFSTALHYAAGSGHAEVVKLLLSKGVSVYSENHHGTPLHLAASHGQESVMKILLHHGADINRPMRGLYTPLICTIMAGSLNCAKLLIKGGADVNLGCPVGLAVLKNNMEMVRCLLDARADPNIPMDHGQLPIEVAAIGGRREMVEILFPLTSPIPEVGYWSLEGLYMHVSSVAFEEKIEITSRKKLSDLKVKGRDAFKRKDFLTAVLFYGMAIALDNNHETRAILFANKSLCWVKAGYGKQALGDACLAQSLRPEWPKAHYRIGAALMLLEDYEKASRAFQDGLKFDPTNEDIKKALSDALDCMKKSQE